MFAVDRLKFIHLEAKQELAKEEQQRVAVVDPGTRISFLFARCRPRGHATPPPPPLLNAAALGSSLI